MITLAFRSTLFAAAAALSLTACEEGGPSLVPPAQVEAMGLQEWQQIRASVPASRNAADRQRMDRVTRKLLAAAGENPSDWGWQVFENPQPNAFALPGKRIGIFSGMMRIADTDAKLATVVAHEIGHLQADHAEERVSAQAASQIGLQVLDAALGAGEVMGREQIGAALGMGVEYGVLLPYSRRNELEADRLGLELMAEAGYNPRAALAFWEGMKRAGGNRGPEFLATHPAPDNRIAQIEEMIAGL